ncbi:hypothetical protein EG329_012229 [Mollisiaceae sp. DMI_Dod_QoI]|nr:hypothetical protein EG329_012229 [Helotiales sp. DMI_Dod_QoI]
MRAFNLLNAIALASTVTAFFPWYPAYRCHETRDCIESKNSNEGHIVGRDPGSSIKIAQRLPEIDETVEVRIRRLGAQLRRKYQRGSPVRVENAQERVVKRTNTYSIMPAATPSQASSAGIDQDGTDYSYFAQVQLGSSSTPMYMLLDTGAGSSWIMGSTCNSGPCSIHSLYNPSTSTTYKALDQSFGVSYGSGSVSGTLGTDTLTLAGLKLPMTLGIVNYTSNDFNAFPMDGILGLSLDKSSDPSFLETLIASKALKSNIFGISLNRASDGPNTGEINFGTPDTSRFSGSLTYASVSSSGGGFWAVPMANVGVGTTQSGITTKLAYIDTGTSFIFCNEGDAKAFHALVPGATTTDNETYHVPCTTTTSVSFTFGSTTYNVSSKDWVSQPSNGVCTSNIYGHDIVGGNWLLGDTFLKNVYVVFDADQSRVGFAQNLAVIAPSTTLTAATSSTSPGMPSSLTGSISTTKSNGPPSGTVATGTGATFTGSTLIPSITASGSTTPTSTAVALGLNGHETSNSGTAAAETSSTQASPTSTTSIKNSGSRLRSSLYGTCLSLILVLIT